MDQFLIIAIALEIISANLFALPEIIEKGIAETHKL